MLKRVSEIPEATRGVNRESMVAKDVREFARNKSMDACEVVIEGKDGKRIAIALRRYIKDHAEQCKGIKCCCRADRAYLYREEAR